ncbi:MAG TPA: hypothetical protein VHL57_03725 [Flavobacteriales bacterium]|jgi:hypothetical protein|nr:hypothetical protein [Flavobacteriales bacterium]
MLNDAPSRTAASVDAPDASELMRDLGLSTAPAPKRYVPGHLQMLRLIRERVVAPTADALTELIFDARPASGHSPVHHVHIVFSPENAVVPPAELEPTAHRLKLYYPASELDALRKLLRSGKDRLCYFWQGATPSRVHAWLFTSP